jgi:hypothetical protein
VAAPRPLAGARTQGVKTLQLLLAAAAAAVLGACAPRPGATRSARLRDLLDAHHFESTCEKVWPAALGLAAERGYPLAEADRRAAGLPPAEGASAGASETRVVGGSRREAETGPGADGRRLRIQGDDDVVGCHVAYRPAPAGGGPPGDPDPELALALVQKVEPQAAQGIEAAANRSPPARRVGDSPRARY